MSDARDRAVRLLMHYLDLAAAGSMPTHRGDFAGEMEELVDCIADTARAVPAAFAPTSKRPCPHCGGSGWAEGSATTQQGQCTVCKGEGKVPS